MSKNIVRAHNKHSAYAVNPFFIAPELYAEEDEFDLPANISDHDELSGLLGDDRLRHGSASISPDLYC